MTQGQNKSRGFAWTLTVAAALLPSAVAAEDVGLAGSEWRPLQVGDLMAPDETDAFVQFKGEGDLSGFSGCNRFFGSWQIDGDTIVMGPIGSTRMACPEPLMGFESALFEALDASRTFHRDGTDLTLLDDEGTELARFAQTDAD